MILPFPKHPEQLRLFHEPLGNHGHVRTLLGDFAEMLTSKLFKGVRYRTDSRLPYCPDVSAHDVYYEVKAVGRTNQTFIYEGRLAKDLAFSADWPLFYVLWRHDVATKRIRDEYELRCAFIAKLQYVLVVPFAEVYEVAINSPKMILNSKYGNHSNPDCYGMGYRLPLGKLQTREHLKIEIEQVKCLF